VAQDWLRGVFYLSQGGCILSHGGWPVREAAVSRMHKHPRNDSFQIEWCSE